MRNRTPRCTLWMWSAAHSLTAVARVHNWKEVQTHSCPKWPARSSTGTLACSLKEVTTRSWAPTPLCTASGPEPQPRLLADYRKKASPPGHTAVLVARSATGVAEVHVAALCPDGALYAGVREIGGRSPYPVPERRGRRVAPRIVLAQATSAHCGAPLLAVTDRSVSLMTRAAPPRG